MSEKAAEHYARHWEDEEERCNIKNAFFQGYQYAMDQKKETALEKFQRIEKDCIELVEESSIERLRFFCSLSLMGQDWLDIEQFFDAVTKEIEELKNRKVRGITIERLQELQDEHGSVSFAEIYDECKEL